MSRGVQRQRVRVPAAALVLAALLAAALASAPRADALVYWANANGKTIGRANLDGTGVNQSFIAEGSVFGVAVNATHVYWSGGSEDGAVGRANVNGSGPNPTLITALAEAKPTASMPGKS